MLCNVRGWLYYLYKLPIIPNSCSLNSGNVMVMLMPLLFGSGFCFHIHSFARCRVGMCHHGARGINCSHVFSPPTTWVPGIRLQLPGLVVRCLYLLSHLADLIPSVFIPLFICVLPVCIHVCACGNQKKGHIPWNYGYSWV